MRQLVPLLFIFISLFLQGCDKSTLPAVLNEKGVTVFAEPILPSPFKFQDKHNESVDNGVFLGHWNILFFGYTYCPDICPMALINMRNLFSSLTAKEQKEYQVWLVSVDPERDTPKVLNEYLNYFNPAFNGLTGNPQALQHFASELHVFYAKEKGSNGAHYLMNHSANLVLVDPQGRYRGFISPPHKPERVKAILQAFQNLP